MGLFLDKAGLTTLWSKIVAKCTATLNAAKQDATDKDTALKNEIANTYATKNQVSALNGDTITIDGADGAISIKEAIDSKVDNTYATNTFATKAEISSAMHYKGTVDSYSNLPTTNTLGDVYNVTDTGKNYAWNGTVWDELSGVMDLSSYLTIDSAANIYLKQTDAINTYITKEQATAELAKYILNSSSDSSNTYNCTVENENGYFDVSVSTAGNGDSSWFKVSPDRIYAMHGSGTAITELIISGANGLQRGKYNSSGANEIYTILDESHALTTAEIEAICV